MEISRFTACAPHGEYDVRIEETHHIQKKDSPSGTAITLAEDIISRSDVKTSWVNAASGERSELEILSYREVRYRAYTPLHTLRPTTSCNCVTRPSTAGRWHWARLLQPNTCAAARVSTPWTTY